MLLQGAYKASVCDLHYKCMSVDTPFFTVLKTWTSPLEHLVITLVCVRLEFPEVSVARLALGPLDSTVLCLVLHQTLVFCLGGAGIDLWGIPTHHRPWLEATGQWFYDIGNVYCWLALFVAGRPFILPKWLFWMADHCSSTFGRYFVPDVIVGTHLFSPPYTCIEGSLSWQAYLTSFTRESSIRESLLSWI